MAKQTHVPLGYAEFHVDRCNESPVWGKNLSKNNTDSLPLCGNPAGNESNRSYFT